MKRRLFMMILVLLGLVLGAQPVTANIEPNQYKEKDVRIKTDILQDGNISETKKELPELQKNLTFTGNYKNKYNELKEQLFLKEMDENNSIISKTTQLGIFSEKEITFRKQSVTVSQSTAGMWDFQLVLFILITITLLSMFFLIVPKLNGMHSDRRQ